MRLEGCGTPHHARQNHAVVRRNARARVGEGYDRVSADVANVTDADKLPRLPTKVVSACAGQVTAKATPTAKI